jgi:4-amino-4-deoxy-L-arabinose transferase-like glycosyltransferase
LGGNTLLKHFWQVNFVKQFNKMDFSAWYEQLDWLQIIVGPVWALLTLIILWMMFSLKQKFGWKHPGIYLLVVLLVVIYLHPVYTDIFPSYAVTQAGNILSLVFTIFICWKITAWSKAVAFRLIPMIVWITAASILHLVENESGLMFSFAREKIAMLQQE